MSGWEPLVTICIPTFNRADAFLSKAIAAALNQSYRNIELLVSDNASSDGTPQLVQGIGDPRIRYHRQASNLGPVGNLDFCIQNSTGEYTLLLMDDDFIEPDFIETCINEARKNPQAGLIRTGARVVDEDGKVIYSTLNAVGGLDFTQFVLAWIDGKTLPFMCSTLFRTAPLKEIGIRSKYHRWDDVMGEFEIAFRYGRIDIPDVKASYCIHPGELTFKEGIREWCEDSRELIELVCRLVPQDEALLRHRLTLHMAALNYRFTLKLEEPWLMRVWAALAVYRTFGVRPTRDIVRSFLSPFLDPLRAIKRFLRRQQPG